MKKLVYYVATSVDGYIATTNGGVEGFIHDEKFVEHYNNELRRFKTVIMGKNTYEFGYQFGLKPGDKAYEHMDHYIFSKSIDIPQSSQVHVVKKNWIDKVRELKEIAETEIYLCGGSQFAGLLAQEKLIDTIRLKVNPFSMGDGIPLFQSNKAMKLKWVSSKPFECGIIENTYEVKQ